MSKKNPTNTGRIERSWLADFRKRFNKLKRESSAYLLNLNKQIVNESVDPLFSKGQILAYNEWLNKQIDNIVLGVIDRNGSIIMIDDQWMREYIEQSYRQALSVSMGQLQAITGASSSAGVLAITTGTAIPVLYTGTIAVIAPIHLNAIGYLQNRAYDSLKNKTNGMSHKINRILVDGVEEGKGIREISRSINKQIGSTKTASELIARTETIQAYQTGVINQADEFNEADKDDEYHVKIMWRAVLDSRTRDLHAKWHGKVMSDKEAKKRIKISPFNCRCSLSLVSGASHSQVKIRRLSAQRVQHFIDQGSSN